MLIPIFMAAILGATAGTAHAELLPWKQALRERQAAALGRDAGREMRDAAGGDLALNDEPGLWVQWPPRGRADHSAIYDPVRDRAIVFGGEDGKSRNDVWVLEFGGEPTWSRLTTSGAPPAARDGHSAIYDPVRDRLIIFGGHDETEALFNDTWALSLSGTPTWEQLAPSGAPPLPRFTHAAAYDAARDRIVVFGGYGGAFPFYLDDTWELSLAGTPAWTQLAPAGTPPGARYEPAMIYDAPRDRMILFGGYAGAFLDDTWEMSLAGSGAWTQLAPSGAAPGGRVEATVVLDAARDRILVFGGFDGDAVGLGRNDVWALNVSGSPAWTQLAPTGAAVPARLLHAAVVDPVRDRMLVFSGYSGLGYPHDTWALSLGAPTAWSQLAPAGGPPQARSEHTAVFVPIRNEVLLFGGRTGAVLHNDVWRLTLSPSPTWTRVVTSGTPPSARHGHSAVYDAQEDRMIVFGGDDGARRNDVWALSLAETEAWTLLAPTGAPPQARSGHSAIYDAAADRMVVFAGLGAGYNNDTWFLLLDATPAWVEHAPSGALPFVRAQHAVALDSARSRMIVIGGRAGSYQNTVWSLDLTGAQQWTQLSPGGGRPVGRALHTTIYDAERDRVVLFGGIASNRIRDDVWLLDLAGTPAWQRRLIVDEPPAARKGHTAVYDPAGDRMIVCSGEWEYGAWMETWALSWDDLPGGELAKSGPDADLAGAASAAASRGAAADAAAERSGAHAEAGAPSALARIAGAAPNPFSAETRVRFSLPAAGVARLDVFDASGRRIRRLLDGRAPAGESALAWDGRDDRGVAVSRGVYFLRLTGAGVAGAPITSKIVRR
jgi:hypothetical protein